MLFLIPVRVTDFTDLKRICVSFLLKGSTGFIMISLEFDKTFSLKTDSKQMSERKKKKEVLAVSVLLRTPYVTHSSCFCVR